MIVGTVEIPISIEMPQDQILKIGRSINIHHVGEPSCNKLENGKLVAKYPEKDSLLQQIHDNLRHIRRASILVDVDENGNWLNFRFK